MLTSVGPLPLGSTETNQVGPSKTDNRGSTATTGVGATEAKDINAKIAAPEQAGDTARLRDGETAESTARTSEKRDLPALDSPTGPPPAFLETPLERAGRLRLEPAQAPEAREPKIIAAANEPDGPNGAQSLEDVESEARAALGADTVEVPPSSTQKAETDFSMVQTIEAGRPVPKLEVML